MKNFTFKLLQQLNKKKADKGFTLIELLVVIIIIGILSAIALPAFLNQAAKAKQSEAKQTLGALNRGQQAYRLESPTFAPKIDLLALGVDVTTTNYAYGSVATNPATGGSGDGDFALPTNATIATGALIRARSFDSTAVRDYDGATAASLDAQNNATTITVICEESTPATTNLGVTFTAATSGTPATPATLACNNGTAL